LDTQAVEAIVTEVRRRLADRQPDRPFLVAIDGPSGAGKSTIAALVAAELNAVVIPSDDFYAAHVSNAEWDARTAEQRAADVIDWRRLRREALEPLLAGRPAEWHPFDFDGLRPDGTFPLAERLEKRDPATVVVLEGAYSAQPALADLIDLAVLVDLPAEVRRERLVAREVGDFLVEWHARWDPAEAHYFTRVRPPASFDLVVDPG
jgi:uridine kinase